MTVPSWNLLFVAFLASLLLGLLSPAVASATIEEFEVPTSASDPVGITAGPDGALWFAERTGNKIGRVTTSGSFSEFAVPTSSSQPFGITGGPDGALWFTEQASNRI